MGQEGRRDRGSAPSPGRESRPPPPGIYMNGRPGLDDTAHIRGVTRPLAKYGHPPPRVARLHRPLAGIPSLHRRAAGAAGAQAALVRLQAEEAEKRRKNSPVIGPGLIPASPLPRERREGEEEGGKEEWQCWSRVLTPGCIEGFQFPLFPLLCVCSHPQQSLSAAISVDCPGNILGDVVIWQQGGNEE